MEEKMLTMKQESEIKEKAQKIKEENKLRIEGADGNVIFNVIVPTNPQKDESGEGE